jgi:hypothetical protein
MVAEVSVHETEVDKVRVGQPASIVMDAFPDQRLTGKVLEVSSLPDQQRGWMNPDLKVYKTLVSIDGTHDFLRSRMSCKVEILVQRLDDVIIIPITVVANRGGRKVCYIVNSQGNREERIVQTGLFNDTFVQIVEGLDVGEKVLLNPPLITETAATEDIFEGVQPLVPEPSASENQGTQTGPGDQTGRGTRRGRRGAGMRGGEGMTEEQLQQLREKFGGQRGGGAPGGEGPTEEQMQQFRNRFGGQSEGGPGGTGLTDEQMKQLREKFQSGAGNSGTRGQNREQQ